ncbi:MAG: hypothetical protein ACRD19_00585, partial [Terriglobia bacterium]
DYNYDGFGHLASFEDGNGNSTNWTYDLIGNAASMADANGHMTSVASTTTGTGMLLTDPLKHTVSTYFDAASKISSVVDKLGLTTTWTYGPLDHPTQVNINSTNKSSYSQRVLSMGYDGLDRISSVADSLTGFTTNFTYDGTGRLTSEQTPALGSAINYGYDASGRRTSMTANGNGAPQTSYGYTYDAGGDLIDISGGPEAVSITYDTAGRRSMLTVGDVVTTYTYDANSRLASLTFTVNGNQIGNLTYAYDGNGRLIT